MHCVKSRELICLSRQVFSHLLLNVGKYWSCASSAGIWNVPHAVWVQIAGSFGLPFRWFRRRPIPLKDIPRLGGQDQSCLCRTPPVARGLTVPAWKQMRSRQAASAGSVCVGDSREPDKHKQERWAALRSPGRRTACRQATKGYWPEEHEGSTLVTAALSLRFTTEV